MVQIRLRRDITFLAAAHGNEESEKGDQFLRSGTLVDYVGESKVPGHLVIRHGPDYIRIKK